MDFIGLLNPTKAPHWEKRNVLPLLRDQLPLQTWLVVGALVQSLLIVTLGRIAFLPPVIYALVRTADVYAMKTGLKANVYKQGVIEQKFSAQFPDAKGDYGNKPARDEVCVLLIGAKSNSPLGVIDPAGKEMGKMFTGMVDQLKANASDYGFLGSSTWLGTSEVASNTVMTVMYFKNADAVHSYSQSPLHLEAWSWWNKDAARVQNLSIFHELYQVPSGNYESIYANIAPTLLAETSYARDDGLYASPVVAAKGLLRSSKGRMSRSDGRDTRDVKFNGVELVTDA